MKLHAAQFAAAGAAAMSAVYGLCAAFLYFKTDIALKLAAQAHLLRSPELVMPYVQVSAGNIISGLAQTFVLGFIMLFIMAWLYNASLENCRCCTCSTPTQPQRPMY